MPIPTSLTKERFQWEGYHKKNKPEDIPEIGEEAVITRSCCTKYMGLKVKVIGHPHYCMQQCGDCGFAWNDYYIEIDTDDQMIRAKYNGPIFMPRGWLKRIGQPKIIRPPLIVLPK